MGEEQTLTMMTATITRLMSEYFSPAQRMIDSHNVLFAEALLDDYPHESVGDITVFIKKAAAASYGEEGKKGKSFGQLTFTTIMAWFQEYMSEKVERVEALKVAGKHKRDEGVTDPRFSAMLGEMKKGLSEGLELGAEGESRQVGLLQRTVGMMTDDELRAAWTKYPSRRAHAVIIAEANKRKLVQKKIEEHLKANHDDQTRISDQGRTAPEADEL